MRVAAVLHSNELIFRIAVDDVGAPERVVRPSCGSSRLPYIARERLEKGCFSVESAFKPVLIKSVISRLNTAGSGTSIALAATQAVIRASFRKRK